MRSKLLSAYLVAVAAWQATVYWRAASGSHEWFYLDPRIGLYLAEGMPAHALMPFFQWATVVALLIVAGGVFLSGHWVRVYLIAEALMALPTVIFFITVLIANISPAHGFSIRELPLPVCAFVVCTVVPWSWAAVLYRSAARRPVA